MTLSVVYSERKCWRQTRTRVRTAASGIKYLWWNILHRSVDTTGHTCHDSCLSGVFVCGFWFLVFDLCLSILSCVSCFVFPCPLVSLVLLVFPVVCLLSPSVCQPCSCLVCFGFEISMFDLCTLPFSLHFVVLFYFATLFCCCVATLVFVLDSFFHAPWVFFCCCHQL